MQIMVREILEGGMENLHLYKLPSNVNAVSLEVNQEST
jgi:hypothetical protein